MINFFKNIYKKVKGWFIKTPRTVLRYITRQPAPGAVPDKVFYFKFQIPNNADGTIVTYSPGWHGTMDRCPKNVTVLLYNDKEGYGIAMTEDTFIPKEVEVLQEVDALSIVAKVGDEPQVYKGAKIAELWDSRKICFKGIPIVRPEAEVYIPKPEEVKDGE